MQGGLAMTNDVGQVRAALVRAVAERKIPDDAIDVAARQIANIRHPIRGLKVCELGICLDYIIDGDNWWQVLPELVQIEGGRLAGIEIFPWGILTADLLHIRVAQQLDVIPQLRG
jgi:hypothetical protein